MEVTERGDRRRFFLVTPGRTGSTLLATILADAGADFCMASRDDWDIARGGWMEHSQIRSATNHFRLAFECSPNKPRGLLSRILWTYHRTAGKRCLKQALQQAIYVKALHLDLAVPFAIKLGYFPQVIVSYRPFGEHALSFSQMVINWSADALAATYNRTYRNSLLLLHSYGGCVVSYADLTDRSSTEWATALGQITGLPADKLLASRDRRLSAIRPAEADPLILDETAERSIAAIDALSGLALPPSPQALRNWRRKVASNQAIKPSNPIHAGEKLARQATDTPSPGASAQLSWVDRLRIEAEAIWKSIRDRRVPWHARVIAPACALAYTIAPIDPIPDRLPIVGHLDDVLVAALLVALFIRLMPAAIKLQHRADAVERHGRRLVLNQ
jgi:uncharacterized membrane protein YkvA (DUF1232 family)